MNIVDLKKSLTPAPDAFHALPPHVAAFSALMIRDRRKCLGKIAAQEASFKGRRTQSDSVASLGYALAGGEGGDDLIEAFKDGVHQLGGRKFFASGRAPRFEVDGIALLGVAAGLRTIDATVGESTWLVKLLQRSKEAVRDDVWQLGLLEAATAILTDSDFSRIPSPELRVAIAHVLGNAVCQDDHVSAWQKIAVPDDEPDIARLSVKRAVFDYSASALASLPVNGAGVEELCRLLENVSQSMSHWTFETKQRVKRREMRRWHIDHEYHVQNLLWTVLKPIFPDLVDEESLPKVGQKTPRCDLGIPSLRIIIEVKFMRHFGRAACSNIIEEIAADASLYLRPDTAYDRVIAFIWDDCRQTEEYRVLTDGLESLDGVEKAILLTRPLRMGTPATATTPAS